MISANLQLTAERRPIVPVLYSEITLKTLAYGNNNMRYPTIDQSEGARAQKTALGFGLTDRALKFARLYAENPYWTITHIAWEAGYSDRGRGAHVRGCEL